MYKYKSSNYLYLKYDMTIVGMKFKIFRVFDLTRFWFYQRLK